MRLIDNIKTLLFTAQKSPLYKGSIIQDRTILSVGVAFNKVQINNYLSAAAGGNTRTLSAFKREVVQDPFIAGEWEKLKAILINSPLDIDPYPASLTKPTLRDTPESAIAHEVNEFLKTNLLNPDVNIQSAISHLAWGLMDFVSGLEIISDYDPKSGKERLRSLVPIPSERFSYIPNTTRLGIQLGDDPTKLTPVDELSDNFIILMADPAEPSPARKGILRKVLLAWLIRRCVIEWWSRSAELNGQPTRVAKVPNDELRAIVEKLLKDAGNSSYLVIPENVNVDFINSASAASNDLFERLINECNQSISIAFFGATQGTAIAKDSGSKQSAGVHQDVMISRIAGYAGQICQVLREQLAKKLVARNFSPEIADAYTSTLKLHVAGYDDINVLSQAVERLVNSGLPLSQSSVYEKTGFGQPEEGEALMVPLQRPKPQLLPTPEFQRFASRAHSLEEQNIEVGKRAAALLVEPYLDILQQAKDGVPLQDIARQIKRLSTFKGNPPEKTSQIVQALYMHSALSGFSDASR